MVGSRIWSRTAEYLSLEDIRPPPLAELHAYWLARCPEGDVPRQMELSPRDLGASVRNTALIDIEQAPPGARYVLVGDALKRLLGRDPTGHRVDEIYGPTIAREVYGAFGRVAEARTASFYVREFQILGKSFGYYRLLLPLRLGEDKAIRRILIGIYPTSDRLNEARDWRDPLNRLEAQEREEQAMQSAWLKTSSDLS